MTKKHFTAIANALNLRFTSALELPDSLRDSVTDEIEQIAISLADQFEEVNPLFNLSKFLAVALA